VSESQLWSLLAPVPFIQQAHTVDTHRQTHRDTIDRANEDKLFTRGEGCRGRDRSSISSLPRSDAASGRPCCSRGTEPHLLLCSTLRCPALRCSALPCPALLCSAISTASRRQNRPPSSFASLACKLQLPCFTRLTRPPFHIPVRDAHQARTAPSMMHRIAAVGRKRGVSGCRACIEEPAGQLRPYGRTSLHAGDMHRFQ
jgi:hypothetical protein